MVGVAPREDKMREDRLRWFGLVNTRLVDAMARKSDMVTIEDSIKRSGR